MKSGCKTGKSGCRTVPAQAVHIATYWELWLSPERGYSPVDRLRLCIVSVVSDNQCSLFLCFSRRLLQRTSQGAVLAMGQWAVEKCPTVHSNSAPKMGAARNWVLRGHCQACPSGFLSGSTLCSRTRVVLQAEGRVGIGQGQDDWEPRASVVVDLEAAGGSWEATLLAVLSQLYMLLAIRQWSSFTKITKWTNLTILMIFVVLTQKMKKVSNVSNVSTQNV